MLKTDFNDELAMREHAASLYEKARQARRMLLKLDTKHDPANRIKFKGAVQWLDSLIEELTFED